MENPSNKTNWGISITDERSFWDKYLINLFINPPKHCKYSKKEIFIYGKITV